MTVSPINLDWQQALILRTNSSPITAKTVLLRSPGYHLYKYQIENETISLLNAGIPTEFKDRDWGMMATSLINTKLDPQNVTVVLSDRPDFLFIKNIHLLPEYYTIITTEIPLKIAINTTGNRIFVLYNTKIEIMDVTEYELITGTPKIEIIKTFSTSDYGIDDFSVVEFFGCDPQGTSFFLGYVDLDGLTNIWISIGVPFGSPVKYTIPNIKPSDIELNSKGIIYVSDKQTGGKIYHLSSSASGSYLTTATNGWQGSSWNYGNPLFWNIQNISGSINTHFYSYDPVDMNITEINGYIVDNFETVFDALYFGGGGGLQAIVGRYASTGDTVLRLGSGATVSLDQKTILANINPAHDTWSLASGYYSDVFYAVGKDGLRRHSKDSGYGQIEKTEDDNNFKPRLLASLDNQIVGLQGSDLYYRLDTGIWKKYLNADYTGTITAMTIINDGTTYYLYVFVDTGGLLGKVIPGDIPWSVSVESGPWKIVSSSRKIIYTVDSSNNVFKLTPSPILLPGLSGKIIKGLAMKDPTAEDSSIGYLYTETEVYLIKDESTLELMTFSTPIISVKSVVTSQFAFHVLATISSGDVIFDSSGLMKYKYGINHPSFSFLVPSDGDKTLALAFGENYIWLAGLGTGGSEPIPEPIPIVCEPCSVNKEGEDNSYWLWILLIIIIALLLLFVFIRHH